MKKILLMIVFTFCIFQMVVMATPWEVDTAVYADKSKLVGSQDTTPYGVAFSSDGTKMYMVGNTNDTVYQYTLSTAWDVSTATYADKSKLVSSQETNPYGVAFSSDGTKMYMVGNTNDTVYQYTLSTAWDVSTATYAEKSYHETQEATPYGIAFSSDGTKMYIVGYTTDTVFQYTLSTAWDVSTATYVNKSKLVSSQDTTPLGVAFSSDGTKMYIVGNATNTVYQYALSTAWDVSTATYANKYKAVSSQDTSTPDVAFSSDGTKMYIMGYTTDTVFQYTLPAPTGNALFFGTNF